MYHFEIQILKLFFEYLLIFFFIISDMYDNMIDVHVIY
jgi:hypothetical protein